MDLRSISNTDELSIAIAPAVIQSDHRLQQLTMFQATHPIWKCRLLTACRAGLLTKEDFRHIFGQYYLYSKNFTRYLAALMMNCEDDYHRARISENLWEEGGGAEPEKRHSELFRRFLTQGLGIDIASIQFQGFARDFLHRYLDFCRNEPALASSAFLSVGTEGIVARLYGYFCEGLLKAGVPESDLVFFRLHMDCDEEHAVTLAELMHSYSDQPGWFEQCKSAIDAALTIRMNFFDDALQFALNNRLNALLDNIRLERSLIGKDNRPEDFVLSGKRTSAQLTALYANRAEGQNIDFQVQRVNFGSEVLDVRLVHIPPQRNNEHHRHPHESLLVVVRGCGYVLVDDRVIDVCAGDMVFVPRWAMHQSRNTGDEPMELVAVTDYGLTRRAYFGDHLRSTRMNCGSDADAATTSTRGEG